MKASERRSLTRWRAAVVTIDHRAARRTGAFARWLSWRIRRAPEAWERYRSACLSWPFRTSRLTNALLNRVKDPKEHHLVRGVCLECLPGHAASGRPKNRLDRKVHRAILDCLRDPHSNVRFWACYAAGQMEISAARSALRGLIDDDGLSCMGWTVGYEATEALKALLGEPAWDDDRLPGECPYPPLW